MQKSEEQIPLPEIIQDMSPHQNQYYQIQIRRVRSQGPEIIKQFQLTTNTLDHKPMPHQNINELVQSQRWEQIQKKYCRENLKKADQCRQSSFSSEDTLESESNLSKILIKTIVGLKKKMADDKTFYETTIKQLKSHFQLKNIQLIKSLNELKNNFNNSKKQCIQLSQQGWGRSLRNATSQLSQLSKTLQPPLKEQSIRQKLQKGSQKAIQIMDEVPVRKIRSKTTGQQPAFSFSDNKIIFNGHIQGNYRQHIKDIIIPKQHQFFFSVKVISSLNNSIMVGIVIRKRKGERSSYESGEAIAYSGKGVIWSGPEMKQRLGGGFKEGDELQVKANLKKNKIEWFVNGCLQASHKIGNFRFEKICPYIEMLSKGDILEWL